MHTASIAYNYVMAYIQYRVAVVGNAVENTLCVHVVKMINYTGLTTIFSALNCK